MHFGHQALTFGATSMGTGHIGFRPGLIDEDEALRVNTALILFPLPPPPRDVMPILFAGVEAFF